MKKIYISIFVVIVSFVSCIFIYSNSNNKVVIANDLKKVFSTDDTLALLYETAEGSGNYESKEDSSWPSDGYQINFKLSRCENGSEISWDSENNRVLIATVENDKCYIYFNKIDTFAGYIKNQYIDGSNGLYYHDSKLENGAGDNSYRYSGANPDNYICFGSDADTCPKANLYRIIGVFNELNIDTGATEARVKLIMDAYPGEAILGTAPNYIEATSNYENFPDYMWNSEYSNNWLSSTLNTAVLNGTYLANLGTTLSNKIAINKWKVGGFNTYGVKAAAIYQNEIVSPVKDTTDDKKVGLMYVSDYGFAASPANWSTSLNRYNNDLNRNNNWLYNGVCEWTISPYPDDIYFQVYRVLYYDSDSSHKGSISFRFVHDYCGARPSFYLNSSVTYASGDGTIDNPYRIG